MLRDETIGLETFLVLQSREINLHHTVAQTGTRAALSCNILRTVSI